MITVWNRAAEQVYGYTADEVIGEDVSIPCRRPFSDKETLLAKIAAGESIENYVTRRTRKDGKLIDVALSISPIGNATDEIVGASVIARDVTEIVHSRAALERVNRSLSLIERCHRALINLNNERELCATVCRLISEIGDIHSFRSPTPIKTIRRKCGALPISARRPPSTGYWSTRWTASCPDRCRGSFDKIAKRETGCRFQRFGGEPASNPWRATRSETFRFVAAFPLCGSTPAAIGSLSIYAAARNAFDDAAIADATMVADDLSLGIRNLRFASLTRKRSWSAAGPAPDQRCLRRTIAAMAAMIGMRVLIRPITSSASGTGAGNHHALGLSRTRSPVSAWQR